jgi:hypothetical protein
MPSDRGSLPDHSGRGAIQREECPVHGVDYGVTTTIGHDRWCQHCGRPANTLVMVEYVRLNEVRQIIEDLVMVADGELEDLTGCDYYRADQREATIRHAGEFLRTLGRDDIATAMVRALSTARPYPRTDHTKEDA